MNEKKVEATDQLIANLKKVMGAKKGQYNDMLYKAAILKVANDILPVKENGSFLIKTPVF